MADIKALKQNALSMNIRRQTLAKKVDYFKSVSRERAAESPKHSQEVQKVLPEGFQPIIKQDSFEKL